MRYRHARCFVWMLCAWAMSGCVVHRHAASNPRPAEPRPAELVQRYTYSGTVDVVRDEEVERRRRFTVRRVELRTALADPDEANDIAIEYFEPRTDTAPHPAILFLPILDETRVLSNFFARRYANRGFVVAVVNTGEKGDAFDALDSIEPHFRTMLIRQRVALDWLAARPEINADRIGAMGISLGGIKAALLKGVDDRIGPTVLGMAGGDIPHIAAYSEENTVRRLRERVLKGETRSFDEALEYLRGRIVTDPLLVAPYVEPGDLLMFVTLHDDAIPTESQEALYRALGEPRGFAIYTDHYTAMAHLFMVRHRTWRFFQEKLMESPRRVEPARRHDRALRKPGSGVR